MLTDIDIVYKKNLIFYHNDIDSKVAAYMIFEHLSNSGIHPIGIMMEHGENYRLNYIDDDTTLWVIGLNIQEEDITFMNRYTSKVHWYLNEKCKTNPAVLLNFTVDDDTTTIITERIYNKYFGKNKFVDKFLVSYKTKDDFYTYLNTYVDRLNGVDEYFTKKEFHIYEALGKVASQVKDAMVNNIVNNQQFKDQGAFEYYVINSSLYVDDIIDKLLKFTDSVVCVFSFKKLNDIIVTVGSNCISLNKLKEEYKGTGTSTRISFKTNTVNVPYLDVPNKIV